MRGRASRVERAELLELIEHIEEEKEQALAEQRESMEAEKRKELQELRLSFGRESVGESAEKFVLRESETGRLSLPTGTPVSNTC